MLIAHVRNQLLMRLQSDRHYRLPAMILNNITKFSLQIFLDLVLEHVNLILLLVNLVVSVSQMRLSLADFVFNLELLVGQSLLLSP